MANATAKSATGQSLFVNDAGTTTTLAPDSAWTPLLMVLLLKFI